MTELLAWKWGPESGSEALDVMGDVDNPIGPLSASQAVLMHLRGILRVKLPRFRGGSARGLLYRYHHLPQSSCFVSPPAARSRDGDAAVEHRDRDGGVEPD